MIRVREFLLANCEQNSQETNQTTKHIKMREMKENAYLCIKKMLTGKRMLSSQHFKVLKMTLLIIYNDSK